MAIIKQYHKDTNTTYVYESISYWDAEKGQSRSKRKVIGKIDPETGDIIPTGKKGPSKKNTPAEETYEVVANYEKTIQELNLTIVRQKEEISKLTRKNEQLQNTLTRLETNLRKCIVSCESATE